MFWFKNYQMAVGEVGPASLGQSTFFEHVGESTCRRGHMSSCRRVESFLVFDDDDDDDTVESRVKDLFFENDGESTCVVVTCHHVGESSLFLVFDDDDDEDDEDDDPVV
jgi:hypothetical protein